ncbi:MAG: site-specific integrase [Desulfobacterales bacterium]
MGVVVRQKKPGKGQAWWVFVNDKGRRKSRKCGSRTVAERVAREIRERLALRDFGIALPAPAPTFGHLADRWFSTYATEAAGMKLSTIVGYRSLRKRHLVELEAVPVNKITRGRVRQFLVARLVAGLSQSRVAQLRSLISGILSLAVDEEIIPANSALGHRGLFRGAGKARREINPLTAEELALLLETVRTEPRFRQHYPLILTLALTGLRVGEAFALEWGDVDFAGRFLNVSKNLVMGRVQTPKNGKPRHVDITPALAEVLKKHLASEKERGLRLGLGGPPKLVFSDRRGGPLDKSHFINRVFTPALQTAGLRRIRVHDLRHTYATLRIKKGDNLADVAGQLGHHSVKVTLDVYSHWLPGQQKAQVDALDSLLALPSAPQAHPEDGAKTKGARNAV